jgi:hypothetical protein
MMENISTHLILDKLSSLDDGLIHEPIVTLDTLLGFILRGISKYALPSKK